MTASGWSDVRDRTPRNLVGSPKCRDHQSFSSPKFTVTEALPYDRERTTIARVHGAVAIHIADQHAHRDDYVAATVDAVKRDVNCLCIGDIGQRTIDLDRNLIHQIGHVEGNEGSRWAVGVDGGQIQVIKLVVVTARAQFER